ncbi:NAD-dependent protein deacylase [Priestia filamentosa]|uniref:NAD-dependent protein deacylase n=1 Tax=Priestia filamentosa TaxID=1402861 RepID=UPI00397C95BA
MGKVKTLASWIKEAGKISILSGAGISAPSNIPTFRGTDGIWNESINREQYLSNYFYNSKPKVFWGKYKEIFQIKLAQNYQPNPAHYFITGLENMGKEVCVLTQNVDGLHQEAGNTNVIELHGTLRTASCPKCKSTYDLEYIMKEAVPRCNRETSKGFCNFILRPDMVLFGDAVKGFKEAETVLDESELLIVIGTSLEVHPVNTLPRYFRYVMNDWETSEPKMALINSEPTKKDELFPLVMHEDIVQVVNLLKEELNFK